MSHEIVWNIVDFYEGVGLYTYKKLLRRKKIDELLVSMAYPTPDSIRDDELSLLMAAIDNIVKIMIHVLNMLGITYGNRLETVYEWKGNDILSQTPLILAMCYFFQTIGAHDLVEIMIHTIKSLQKQIKFPPSFQQSVMKLENEFIANQTPLSIKLMEVLAIEDDRRILDMEETDTGLNAVLKAIQSVQAAQAVSGNQEIDVAVNYRTTNVLSTRPSLPMTVKYSRPVSGLKDPFDDDDDELQVYHLPRRSKRKVLDDDGDVIDIDNSLNVDQQRMFEKMCPGLDGLNYNDNSCYQDTTLLCLIGLQNPIRHALLTPNPAISDEARTVQRELIFLSRVMRKETEERKTCGILRSLISRTDTDQDRFSGTEEQDAGEFVMYLFDLIKVPQISFTLQRVFSAKNGSESDRTIQRIEGDPIMKVSSSSLQEGVSTQDIVLHTVDRSELDPPFRGYDFKEEVIGIDNANFLIIYVDRLMHDEHGEEERNELRIAIDPKIRLLNPLAPRLELYAMIVHRSHHYIAFFKCTNVWWLYNDLSDNHFEHVGTLDNVITHKENPSEMGTLFFYRTE